MQHLLPLLAFWKSWPAGTGHLGYETRGALPAFLRLSTPHCQGLRSAAISLKVLEYLAEGHAGMQCLFLLMVRYGKEELRSSMHACINAECAAHVGTSACS
jgi:hypothetical protein